MEDSRLNINIHMFIFLMIACIALLNDVLIYFFKFSYDLGLCISTIVMIVIFIIARKK